MGTNEELITFHVLRHTFATQWIRQGGDIKALQSILGHKDAMVTLNAYADIEPISKIHNMLRVSPCLWRGHLGLRVDPGPMFQQRIQESIETLQAFGYGVTEPGRPEYRHTRREDDQPALPHRVRGGAGGHPDRGHGGPIGAPPAACAAERYPLPKGRDALRFQFGISRRRRSADCGNGLSAQCVRLRSKINPTRAGHAPDGSTPCGLPPHAHVADV